MKSKKPTSDKRVIVRAVILCTIFFTLPTIWLYSVLKAEDSPALKGAKAEFIQEAPAILEALKNSYPASEEIDELTSIPEELRTSSFSPYLYDIYIDSRPGRDNCKAELSLEEPGGFGLPGDNLTILSITAQIC